MSGDGGPAFPVNPDTNISYKGEVYAEASGLSKREWFAGQALAGLLASGPHDCDEHGVAHDALLHADALIAMLAARERDDG